MFAALHLARPTSNKKAKLVTKDQAALLTSIFSSSLNVLDIPEANETMVAL
jgi:hypothetical protein